MMLKAPPYIKIVVVTLLLVVGAMLANSVLRPKWKTGETTVTLVDCGKTLKVSGEGAMMDYYWNNFPWPSPWPYRNVDITAVVIKKGVTRIGSQAFARLTGLTSVTIPGSVVSIGEMAFWDCRNLTSVTIEDGVTSIGHEAFNYTGLTSIAIPGSVTTIGNTALVYFNHDLGEYTTDPRDGIFYGCNNLTSIKVAADNPSYSSEDGVLFNKNKTTLLRYPLRSGQSVYTIPSSVTSIERGAFAACTGLTSVTIPGSVEYIGEEAFGCCTGLTSINVNKDNPAYSTVDGVLFNKAKDELIQYPCGKQGAYVIPDGVTFIGRLAFVCNSGLTSVTIPSSVTSIGTMWIGYAGTDLTSVICLKPFPPHTEHKPFETLSPGVCLYVPKGSVDTYRATVGWDKFDCIKPLESAPKEE